MSLHICQRIPVTDVLVLINILPTGISVNYFMFLPFFPRNLIFTVPPRLRYTQSEHNRLLDCGDLNLIPLGSVRAGWQQEQTCMYLVRKYLFLYSGSFTLFSMTLLNRTRCSSFSFPVFQKNKQRPEYLFPLLFKTIQTLPLMLFVNHVWTYVYLYNLHLYLTT